MKFHGLTSASDTGIVDAPSGVLLPEVHEEGNIFLHTGQTPVLYFSDGTIWHALMNSSDTAAAATKIATPRLISGVPFDGTADITISAANIGALESGATAVAATKLETARTIAGVSFDGTANISITAANVGALASGGTAVAATKLATARTIAGVSFDGTANINISAANVGALDASGTAVQATKLANARTINSVSFDGTANIQVPTGCTQPVFKVPTTQRHIAGAANGTALGTIALTANRIYFVPFIPSRRMTLTALGINVSTLTAGTGTVGVYAADGNASFTYPGTLLASSTVGAINTGSVGTKTGTLNYTLEAGVMYFVAFVNSAAATVRGIAVGGQTTSLGFTDNAATVISYYYVAGSNTTLPATAGAPTVAAGVVTPGIHIIE